MPSFAALLHRARALATGDRFLGALEEPRAGAAIAAALTVSGWTLSRSAPIARIEAFVDHAPIGEIPFGLPRPDVAAVFPALTDGRCGYSLRAWLDDSMRGGRLEVRVTDRAGHVRSY